MQRTYQLSEFGPTRVEGRLATLLVQQGRRHRFPAGKLIQQRGDKDDGFWLVEAGTVNVCRFDAEGHVTVFAVLGEGDLFGELAHFAGLRRQVDAIAESDATLIRIDTRLVDHLLAEEPEFARWLLKSLAIQLRSALDRIDGERTLSAEARLIHVLAEMARRDGPELAVTQQGLAELVGVSRVTVGQVLGKLAKAGLVRLHYRRIFVPDVETCRPIAQRVREFPPHKSPYGTVFALCFKRLFNPTLRDQRNRSDWRTFSPQRPAKTGINMNAPTKSVRLAIKIFATVVGLVGLILLGGGLYLMFLGGSWYYALAGGALAWSGWRSFHGDITGIWIYLGVFALTLIWALFEVGFTFWPQVPRMVAPLFLAAWALFLVPSFPPQKHSLKGNFPFRIASGVLFACFFIFMAGMFFPHDVIRRDFDVQQGRISLTTQAMGGDWTSYGRTGEGTRYAPLDQINRDNVAQLEQVWVARSGDVADESRGKEDQNTPIFAGGKLYQCSPSSQVTAIDPSTGKSCGILIPKQALPFGNGAVGWALFLRPHNQRVR